MPVVPLPAPHPQPDLGQIGNKRHLVEVRGNGFERQFLKSSDNKESGKQMPFITDTQREMLSPVRAEPIRMCDAL